MAIIILIMSLLFALPVYAAPSVSGYSGVMANGSSVTINGSNFGSNSAAGTSAIEFLGGSTGAIESGTPGTGFSRSRWSVDTEWGHDIQYSTNTVPWGNHVLQMTGSGSTPEAPLYYNLPSAMTSGDHIYVSWWERVTWAGNGQYKIIRFSPTQTIVDSPGQQTVFFFHNNSGGVTFGINGGPYMLYPTFSPAVPQSTWARFDVDMTLSSSSGKVSLTKYTPGSSLQTTSGSGKTFGSQSMNYIVWQNYFGTDGSGAMTAGDVRFKDIYISHGTNARVEICNTSTWAARTTCMIQLPTAWSASSIAATVNPGLLTGSAYLYVVDSTGAVNSTGYPVTFGAAGGTPPPAPPPPPALAPSTPTIKSIN